MSKHLVIVESPAKAKTIEKYLGKDFQVLASYGHVRDLVPKEGAVDPDHDFAMKYEVIERNLKHVQAISKALKTSDTLYLATDPDREGEAISWHLHELLKDKKLLKDKPVHRVIFHEITKKAVTEAIANPEQLAINLINAQQARRALDYLVGFNLSPLLWKKIRRGLSAGRVQSPALRMIVERELEIEAFKTREYWTIDAALSTQDQAFKAKLTHFDGAKLTQFSIDNETLAEQTKQTVLAAADGQLIVAKLEKKQQKRNPAPPFITSTLQQEAARKLGFTTKRTMMVAQQLYEGIDIGGETDGLI
ncbi:MAG: DNA topoisomerase, partial [Methylovulum sp.]|nr:DNA topoisomerase [Methylovulum sp.]